MRAYLHGLHEGVLHMGQAGAAYLVLQWVWKQSAWHAGSCMCCDI